ncbi:MAG: hypothetical protein M3422_20920, partial [Actinomycetota bacterium]|nr:hypothetical protein [Actinomycetota bacterium]
MPTLDGVWNTCCARTCDSPSLDFGSKYDLSGGHAYVDGIWASTLNYRQSNGTFYWAGCID